MANETTTTTMTGFINTSLISAVMIAYAIDPFNAILHLRMEQVPQGTKTLAVATTTKSSGVAQITEGTAMSNSALTTANTTIAIAEYGILRLVTKLVARTNVLGEFGTYQYVIEDGARLCMEKMETDAWAQFANASTSVGTSGANFTIANYAAGVSQMTINKARGPYQCHLSSYQARDLRAAIAATTGAVWVQNNNGIQNVVGDDGYMGTFMGIPTWTSNLAASSGGDKVGAFLVDGASNPRNASTVIAYGWMPEPEFIGSPSYPGRQIAVTTAYGMSEVLDAYYTKIVTIGS